MYLDLDRRVADGLGLSLQVSNGFVEPGSKAETPRCENLEYEGSESRSRRHLASCHSDSWLLMQYKTLSRLLVTSSLEQQQTHCTTSLLSVMPVHAPPNSGSHVNESLS